jgi:hypothetical protein
MSGVRALRRQPVTVALSAAVLAMISNLAVNEPGTWCRCLLWCPSVVEVEDTTDKAVIHDFALAL